MADDAVLLAVSDTLVLKALERAATSALPRSARSAMSLGRRCRAYEDHPLDDAKIDAGLRGMWDLCPMLAGRHDLDVDVLAWQQLLDTYTRALLMMGEPHRVARLAAQLNLAKPTEWAMDDAG